MSVEQKFITDLKTFEWGDKWRAVRLHKEKRFDGDYYFAYIVRYYGEKENTHDYDVGDTLGEHAWLGRQEKFVGKRKFDTDHDSPTFGKRIYTPAITEDITIEDNAGKTRTRKVLVEGKTIYEYTLPVTDKNTKSLRTLVGSIALNQDTKFSFLYGAVAPLPVDKDEFFSMSVKEFQDSINPLKNKNDTEN